MFGYPGPSGKPSSGLDPLGPLRSRARQGDVSACADYARERGIETISSLVAALREPSKPCSPALFEVACRGLERLRLDELEAAFGPTPPSAGELDAA